MKAHALDSLVNPHATDNLTFVCLGFFSDLQAEKNPLFTLRENMT